MITQTNPQAENLQDSLRTMRVFVNNLGGRLVDQAMALTDASVSSSPYQYQTVTTAGTAIEGSRTTLTPKKQAVPGIENKTLFLIVGVAVAGLLIRR